MSAGSYGGIAGNYIKNAHASAEYPYLNECTRNVSFVGPGESGAPTGINALIMSLTFAAGVAVNVDFIVSQLELFKVTD